MRNKKNCLLAAAFAILILTGCQNKNNTAQTSESTANNGETFSETISETSVTVEPAAPEIEYSESDKMAIGWFMNDMTDIEAFADMTDYQYYARTLGLDKDYFLDPEMWEVYYNESININKDIDDKEYYLIRLDPRKLLEIYAEKNNTEVEKLCDKLSVTPEQLYYNWGYNPSSIDYGSKHEKNIATYSKDEQEIFGAYNGEHRQIVMSTHLLIVDNAENICSYQSKVTDALTIRRRDMLQAFTETSHIYSAYTDAEKSSAFTVSGIGIRAVIPLTLPNAWSEAAEADSEITPMINASPYSYGCTNEDTIDIMTYINEQSENKK